MNKGNHTAVRRAFSLLELIIVILIVSLSAMLVFTAAEKSEKEPEALTLLNLKSTLLSLQQEGPQMEFFCLDKCRQCYIEQDGNVVPYENKIGWNEPKAYTLSEDDSVEEIDFGRYDDHPVCLRFTLFGNGSSSQLIIQDRYQVFYLPSFFGKPREAVSLEEAKEFWLEHTRTLSNHGDIF